MASANLKAEPRSTTGKGANRKMRAAGRVPAVVYGRNEDTRKLSLDAHALSRLLATVHVENTIVDLDIEGEGAVKALVREIQTHAHRDVVLHVDFYQIHAGEKVTVAIPLRFVGAAPGVKEGGMLQHTLDELEVRCLPAAIPEHFEIDITGLAIGDSVHVSAVSLPEGVELLEDPDRTVCTVLPPTVIQEDEEEEEDVIELGDEEPEVIGREKEEGAADDEASSES
jgi:large subunit ribosomal protein L25